jgi:CHAD domain-containing protein
MAHADNYIPKYYNNELHSFEKKLRKTGHSFSKKNIHKLRTEIKRLKALYRLIEQINPREFSSTKHYRQYKRLFKVAGKIREIQLNTKLLASYKLSPSASKAYINFIKKKEKAHYNKLKKLIKDFPVHKIKKSKKRINRLYKDSGKEKFNKKSHLFIIAECIKIRALRRQSVSVANLHETRKHLKSLGSVAELMYEMNSPKVKQQYIDKLKGTESLIGDWHDQIVLIDSLQSFLNNMNKLPETQVRQIKKTISLIRAKNRKLLVELKPKIDETCRLFMLM